MLCRLGRALVGHLRRLVAPRVAQDAPPQPQRLRMGLEREGTVERQQRPVAVAQPERGVPQLVPGERQVRVGLDRLLEGAERFAIALQLDQRRTLQRERERRVPELRACPLGEVERLLAPPVAAEQLDRKSTRLNSSHTVISYAVFCLKKKKARSLATDA